MFATAKHAAIALAARTRLPSLISSFKAVTLWTFLHFPILAHFFNHSRYDKRASNFSAMITIASIFLFSDFAYRL
jgi:hypothetical protein